MTGPRPLLAGAVAAGAVAAGTYLLADWPAAAMANGIVYFAAFGLLTHVHHGLRDHVDDWNDVRASTWSAGFGGLIAVCGAVSLQLLDLPTWEGAAVLALLLGVATAAFAIGIGMTLAYLEPGTQHATSGAAQGASPADRS